MRVLMRYLRPVALQNISGVLALVAFSYIAIQVPRYIKELINQLEGIRHTVKASSQGLEPSVYAAAKTDIFYACLIILVLGLLSALLLFAARWLIIGASRQIEKQMRDDLFAHIEKLTPRFYQSYRTGDLITRFASDIEQVRLLLGPGIMYPGQTCLLTLLALYYMFMLSTSLALTLLIPIGVLLIYVNFNTRQLHKVYHSLRIYIPT